MKQEHDIAALVAVLPRVRGYISAIDRHYGNSMLSAAALDHRTGYPPALEAVAALAERERRLREAAQAHVTAHLALANIPDNLIGVPALKALVKSNNETLTALRALLAEAQEETHGR